MESSLKLLPQQHVQEAETEHYEVNLLDEEQDQDHPEQQKSQQQEKELEQEDEEWMRSVLSSEELLNLSPEDINDGDEKMDWNNDGWEENNISSSFSEDFISWSEDIHHIDADQDSSSSEEEEEDVEEDANLTEPCNERLVKQGLSSLEIQNKLDHLQEKLLLLTTDYYSWEPIYSKDGLDVTKKTALDGRHSSVIRGQIFLPFSISEIISILVDTRFRRELEPSVSKCPAPHWISDHTAVEYLLYHPVWPATARDACNLLHWRLLKNGLFLYYATSASPASSESSSVSSSLYPEREGVVRSHLSLGGYVMRHVQGGTLLFLLVEVTLFSSHYSPTLTFIL
jgi:hypothetical protein